MCYCVMFYESDDKELWLMCECALIGILNDGWNGTTIPVGVIVKDSYSML